MGGWSPGEGRGNGGGGEGGPELYSASSQFRSLVNLSYLIRAPCGVTSQPRHRGRGIQRERDGREGEGKWKKAAAERSGHARVAFPRVRSRVTGTVFPHSRSFSSRTEDPPKAEGTKSEGRGK